MQLLSQEMRYEEANELKEKIAANSKLQGEISGYQQHKLQPGCFLY